MFHVVPCVTFEISWKFYENQLHFTVMLLTNTPSRLNGRLWNSLVRRETALLIISCVVTDVSWKLNENPSTRFSIISLTNTEQEIRLFLVSCHTLAEISWKSVHLLSHNVANRHRLPWKCWKRNHVSQEYNVTPPNSRLFLPSCQTYENFMKIGLSLFPQCCWQKNPTTNQPTGMKT